MAAGVAAPYDLSGFETKDLVNGQWPKAPGPKSVRDFSTTNAANYGTRVPCNANCVYVPPDIPAGTSIRMGAFYEKTGVRQHRLEPGFRDKRAECTYTELPISDYGTLRRSTRLPTAGSAVLGETRPLSPGGASKRSNASGASRRSRQSEAANSAVSSIPSWAKRTSDLQRAQPWDFRPLQQYRRTNESYGSGDVTVAIKTKPAGQSNSGFVDVQELVKTLTRPH